MPDVLIYLVCGVYLLRDNCNKLFGEDHVFGIWDVEDLNLARVKLYFFILVLVVCWEFGKLKVGALNLDADKDNNWLSVFNRFNEAKL